MFICDKFLIIDSSRFLNRLSWSTFLMATWNLLSFLGSVSTGSDFGCDDVDVEDNSDSCRSFSYFSNFSTYSMLVPHGKQSLKIASVLKWLGNDFKILKSFKPWPITLLYTQHQNYHYRLHVDYNTEF